MTGPWGDEWWRRLSKNQKATLLLLGDGRTPQAGELLLQTLRALQQRLLAERSDESPVGWRLTGEGREIYEVLADERERGVTHGRWT